MSEVTVTASTEIIDVLVAVNPQNYVVTVTVSAEELAKQYALEAFGYKEEAEAAAIATAADVVQTGLDADATAADRIATGLDAAAAAADRIATGLDADATAADRIQAGLDRIATGADRIQTGLDVIETTEQATIATEAALLAVESSNSTLIQDLGSITGTVAINLNLGTLIKATLTGAVTLSFTGLPSATSEKGFTLRFSGVQMIVFPVGTLFASGDAPTPAGTLYDIPCSISSAGVVIVYGSINTIEI